MLTDAATAQMAVAVTVIGSLVHLTFRALHVANKVFCSVHLKHGFGIDLYNLE